MEYQKLRGRIVAKYGTIGKFADAVGLSRVSVSKKLNGASEFSKQDIELWSKLLGITKSEYYDYFF